MVAVGNCGQRAALRRAAHLQVPALLHRLRKDAEVGARQHAQRLPAIQLAAGLRSAGAGRRGAGEAQEGARSKAEGGSAWGPGGAQQSAQAGAASPVAASPLAPCQQPCLAIKAQAQFGPGRAMPPGRHPQSHEEPRQQGAAGRPRRFAGPAGPSNPPTLAALRHRSKGSNEKPPDNMHSNVGSQPGARLTALSASSSEGSFMSLITGSISWRRLLNPPRSSAPSAAGGQEGGRAGVDVGTTAPSKEGS